MNDTADSIKRVYKGNNKEKKDDDFIYSSHHSSHYRSRYLQHLYRMKSKAHGVDVSGKVASHRIDISLFLYIVKRYSYLSPTEEEIQLSIDRLSERLRITSKERNYMEVKNNHKIIKLIEGKGNLTKELRRVISVKLNAIYMLQKQSKSTFLIDLMCTELENILNPYHHNSVKKKKSCSFHLCISLFCIIFIVFIILWIIIQN